MDYGDRKETFPYISINIGMGVIFHITNRVNNQIILQTTVWIIKVIQKF